MLVFDARRRSYSSCVDDGANGASLTHFLGGGDLKDGKSKCGGGPRGGLGKGEGQTHDRNSKAKVY